MRTRQRRRSNRVRGERKSTGIGHVDKSGLGSFLRPAGISILVAMLAVAGAEMAIRVLYPEINREGTEKTLLMEGAFGESVGLKPNSRGRSMGIPIKIDQYGFREMMGPETYREAWLFLGDSVTFGVGVDTKDTFAGLLQNRYSRVKIWNTAVMGYSILNYQDVFFSFFESDDGVRKIFLFMTLNDVYGYFNKIPKETRLLRKVKSFLRSRLKLYVFLKHLTSDLPKTYFVYDYR